LPVPIHFTIDQLLVLEATARLGSFSKAAKALHRVPSAVTYSVKMLEDALSLKLFDRSGARASLTPEGVRILEEARLLLRSGEQIQRLAGQLADEWEAELRIVVDGVLPMYTITQTLAALRMPDIPTRIRLDVEFQEGVVHRFLNDRCDVMLCLDILDNDPRVVRQPLPELELLLVCESKHPLAGLSDVTKSILQQHIELLVKDSAPQFVDVPKSSYLGSRHVVYLSDFHAKKQAIAAGVGFGWLPRYLIRSELEDGSIVPIHFNETSAWTYHPQLVTWKDSPLGRAGRQFVSTLLESIKAQRDNVAEND
jgi:DNA-binding transcriptional LysR family regulator